MPNDVLSLVLSIIGASISVATAFYIKDFLERRAEYRKLRRKLEGIAGKNAEVIYIHPSQSGIVGPLLYKIKEINESGVTLENELHSIFVPTSKLLQSEMILPSDHYDTARKKAMKRYFDEVMDAMVEPLIEKLIPVLRDTIVDEMGEVDTEVSAVIGIKIRNVLEESGFEIKRIESKDSKPK